MKLEDYNYDLPTKLIAQKPIIKRDESRLMVANKNSGIVEHKKFSDIIEYFLEGDVLVLNESKVKPSVFFGKKSSGAPARLVLIKKIDKKRYECRVKSRTPKVGNKYFFENFSCELVSVNKGLFVAEFDKNIDRFIVNAELLYPDYVKNKEILNKKRYQTVYAKTNGSLAAPTAGLHFTKELLKKLEKKGVIIAKICLHVSYGTFIPVYDLSNHSMEEEYFEITQKSANIINNAKRLFVVGTTSLKTLESSANDKGIITPKKGFSTLFITPKHKIKTQITGLITNLHLPKSTLLLLVSSFFGTKRILELYNIAIMNKYKFYSFGDSMLLIK